MNKFCKGLIFIAVLIISINIIITLVGSVFYEAQMFFEPGRFEFGFAKYRTIGRIILEISLYMSIISIPIAVSLILYAILKLKLKKKLNKIVAITINIILAIILFCIVNYDYFRIYTAASELLNRYNWEESAIKTEGNCKFINIKNYEGGSIFEYSPSPCGVLIYSIDGSKPHSVVIDGHPMYWIVIKLDSNWFLSLKILNCHDF